MKPKETILLAAQEISFAKALASNDKNLRDRALKKLKKWLSSKSQRSDEFSEEGFMRIWKGLFYCVWMSDKPLVQEECVESISNLIHCFENFDDALKFVRCFFLSMTHGWFGLDGHRMDKYLMLVRRFLRQTFETLYKLKWETESVQKLSKDLTTSFSMAPLGLILHLSDIYMEELAKVGRGELKAETTLELLKPFVEVMSKTTDNRLLLQITNNVFLYLLRQSEEGVKHSLKFQAWKQLGFPGGDIDLMEEIEPGSDEEIENDIEETHQTALDARAGNVDVELPEIDFNATSIAEYLESLKTDKDISTKFRKQINHIINKYKKYSEGKYPLGTHRYEMVEKVDEDDVIQEAAEELYKFEDDSVDSFKKDKERKKRPRSVSNEWEVSLIEDNEDVNDTSSANSSWVISDLPIEEEKQPKVNKKKKKEEENKKKKPKLDTELTSVKEHSNVTEQENSNITEPQMNGLSKKKKKNKRKLNDDKKEKNESKTEINPNTSEWGDCSWEFPEENHEAEIIVQPKKPKNVQVKTPKSAKISTTNVTSLMGSTPGSGKKVEFVLNRNMSQEEKEYFRTVKKRPSIPYDADKKPPQSALKTAPFNSPSPVNPFYKMKGSLKKKSSGKKIKRS